MRAIQLPAPVQERLDAATGAYVRPAGGPAVDFTQPAGEPALCGPDSVSWRVFKNPISLFVGGVTAVLLELAEPRVRSGVWDHTTFRTDPLARMKRTGLAAMVTVYGARSVAEKMIAGVNAAHARVRGTTPAGAPYAATDRALLDWVQATASFGFLEAYAAYVHPLTHEERDRFYAESAPAARLYGAEAAPSAAALEAQFAAMAPHLEPSPILSEFLAIMHRTPALPPLLRPLQGVLIRAAIDILPDWSHAQLQLNRSLTSWERRLVRWMGALADRIVLRTAPPAQACLRLGLPADYLYTRR